jgi:hypothetical protein
VPDGLVTRQWLVFVLDIVALQEAKKCVENSFWDPICQTSCWGESDFSEHIEQFHSEVDYNNARDYLEFKRILLEPGGKHIELNFNSNWHEIDHYNFVETLIMASGLMEKQAYYQAFNKNNHIPGGWRQIIVEAVVSEAVPAFLKLSALYKTDP